MCDELVRVPLINMAWEQALAFWGQHTMSADEHKRRMLTHTLHSSTVRATTAVRKLFKQQVQTHKIQTHKIRILIVIAHRVYNEIAVLLQPVHNKYK